MNEQYVFSSLTRISPLARLRWDVDARPWAEWETGDYVVCEVDPRPEGFNTIELATGRMAELYHGDYFVGVLGERFATVEATGSWREVGEDAAMQLLTSAGLLGRVTSKSSFIPPLLSGIYRGHVILDGTKATMQRFVQPVEERTFQTPTVLMMGTSMSAGKTLAAQMIIGRLRRAGLRVLGAKLAGAGRYKDIQSMGDAGAEWIYDFVDVGLPSTLEPPDEYRESLQQLLSMIAAEPADVAVIEVGASPLEPYNGSVAIEAIRDSVRCTVLAATDAYAAYGLMQLFDVKPDLVCGLAVNTSAGVEMVEKFCDVPALNVADVSTHAALDRILFDALGELGAVSRER
jgi:hypothetical protein